MIYKTEPDNFISRFEVVSCYLEHDGEILILHRHDHKPEGNTWGLPAGKIDKDENEFDAVTREIFEETGLEIDPGELEYLEKLYVVYPTYQFIFHMFKLPLEERPRIKISDSEHKEYKWAKPEDVLKLDLIPDFDECLKISYNL
jgi:8-oxo-dGTP pyrophosphatase MutT (NUDIX family)